MDDDIEEMIKKNVYNFVKYDYRDGSLYIYWDSYNKSINKYLTIDRYTYKYKYIDGYYYNCCWIDELKQRIGWEIGNKIRIRATYICPGEIRVDINNINTSVIFEEIDENGYLLTPIDIQYNNGFEYKLEKCNCTYNDLMDERYGVYVLK
jgi:hypothetical protein